VCNIVSSLLGPGIDVKGDGGGIWAPPSIHESGKVYEWLQEPAAVYYKPKIPPLNLIRIMSGELIYEPGKPLRRKPSLSQRALGAVRANKPPSIDRALAKLASASKGTRNRQLYSAAFVCGKAVAAGVAGYNDVVSNLRSVAQSIGLDRFEIDATIKSGMSAGEMARD
jgi:hypothetical protein